MTPRSSTFSKVEMNSAKSRRIIDDNFLAQVMGESSEIALTYAKIFLRELSPKNDFLDTATWVFFNDSSLEFWTSVSVESAIDS